MSEVTTRLKEVQNRIEAARMRSPYHQDVTLVAVTKFHPVSEMKEVIAQGVTQVGENRVQEMEEKYEFLSQEPITWNLQGHLQKNKVKKAVAMADLIHSGDSISILQEIDKRPARLGRCRMCCWNSIFPVRRPRQVSSRMPLKKRWKPLRHSEHPRMWTDVHGS